VQVREALAKFVDAFDNLDWETFRLAFDDEATVFYPRAFPERANGRAEFEKTFKVVFQQIRSGKTTAPYMDIQPKDMKLQMFGDVAIATFHLDDRAGFLNRRTIVLAKTKADLMTPPSRLGLTAAMIAQDCVDYKRDDRAPSA
jgi:ketosteroid isomerase-like protein